MIVLAARLAIAFAAWCMAGSAPAQQRDWIDAFPSVTAVARAAYEELKVSSVRAKLNFTQDDDSIAVNLAGTFMILRGIMFLKYHQEEDMSPEREEKLRKLVAVYEEAELAIGNGAQTRQGYITRGPPTGHGCNDMTCYRRWFANDILNISGRAEYRERILNRLFPCEGLAKAFYDLRQAQGLRMPHMPSPAATLQLDAALVGVAPPGCDIYGGDEDQDGLCDAWEPSTAASKTAAPVPKCEPVQLLRVKSDAAAGLIVTIANNTAMPGDRIAFRVLRAKEPKMDATALELWTGEATVEPGPASDVHPVARIAEGAALASDAARPFLIVEAPGVPNKGPVQCEQALVEWLDGHQKNPPKGLHGPYSSVEQAVSLAGSLALQLTSNVEYGFVVVRDWRQPSGHYYATAPVRSSHDSGNSAAQPLVLPEDFYRSFDTAVTPSCVEADALELAAIVHTHPDTWLTPNNFSMQDFNQAIGFVPIRSPMWFGAGMKLRSKFEKTVLITADDRCVRTFVPQEGDETFSKPELWLDSAAVVLQLYRDYTDRVSKVGCYK